MILILKDFNIKLSRAFIYPGFGLDQRETKETEQSLLNKNKGIK